MSVARDFKQMEIELLKNQCEISREEGKKEKASDLAESIGDLEYALEELNAIINSETKAILL